MGNIPPQNTSEFFSGLDNTEKSIGHRTTKETDEYGILQLRSHHKQLLKQIDFSNTRVLDIGFGRGEAIYFAYMNGASFCAGVDFAETAMEIAQGLITQRNLPEAELYLSDALSFICDYARKYGSDPAKKFDVVLMLDFIEYIPRGELREMLECLKKILTERAVIALNTPAYKYDNDEIQNGFDERNPEDYYETDDANRATKGMHYNKYSQISLQMLMSECGFINLTEAHFFVNKALFKDGLGSIDQIAYSERWQLARQYSAPLQVKYQNDLLEYPYGSYIPPTWVSFAEGNMSSLSILLNNEYKEIAFPSGNFDKELFESVMAEEVDQMIVFDVGGFDGVSSLIFAKLVGPSGRVIVFEPNQWNRNRIFLNLSNNEELASKVWVSSYALGNMNGQTTMTISSNIDNGYSSTSRLDNSHPKIPTDSLPNGFFQIDVEVCKLDWFVDTFGIIPNVINIDVEGAEHNVLLGGLRTITNHKPVLLIELHSEFCAFRCTELLLRLGYMINFLKEEADSRLLVKAVYNGTTKTPERQSIVHRLLENLNNQHEIAFRLQKAFVQEEDRYRSLELKHQEILTEVDALRVKQQRLQSEYQNLQSGYQALLVEHQTLTAERDALHALYTDVLNSKLIRFSSKVKSILRKFV